MSERRFTRLKASLSKETAAKTRETVSRELRQSMSTASADASLLYCIDADYERGLRQWTEELLTLYGSSSTLKKIDESVAEGGGGGGEGNNDEQQQPTTTPPTCNPADLLAAFSVADDDMQVVNEPKENQFDFARYYPAYPERTKPSSAFAHECILHYTDSRHLVRWKSLERHFGTVFDTCLRGVGGGGGGCGCGGGNDKSSDSSSAFLANNSAGGPLEMANGSSGERPIFECDLEAQISALPKSASSGALPAAASGFLLSTQNRLIRDGSASVLSLEAESIGSSSASASPSSESTRSRPSASNTIGWLTLTRDDTTCFLTFYDSRRRDKILWHIEVNRKVSKLAEPPSALEADPSEDASDSAAAAAADNNDPARSCFRVAKHLIFTDQRFTDDWIKDINSNISEELDPRRELARILAGDSAQIAERLKSSKLLESINLMAAYSTDLLNRRGSYSGVKNAVQRIGFRGPLPTTSYYRFILSIRGFEISSNDRNKMSTITTGALSSLTNGTGGGGGGGGGSASSHTSSDSYFLRICLFDARQGKISEEFRFTVSPDIKGLRPSAAGEQNRGFDQRLLCNAYRAAFSVDLSTSVPTDVYLVLRIERSTHRLLHYHCSPTTAGSGSSSSSNSSSSSSNLNNNKAVQQGIISSHSEPYAWSLRPLFQDGSTATCPVLETSPSFGIFFKLDQNRLSDEFIFNSLKNLQLSSEKSGGHHHSGSHSSSRSQTALNGRLEIDLQPAASTAFPGAQQSSAQPYNTKHTGTEAVHGGGAGGGGGGGGSETITLNPSLFVRGPGPSGNSKALNAILEIQSLRLLALPFNEYFNLLYIYPLSLKFDSQKVFSKARNLCVTVEIRDSDETEGPQPPRALPIIFGRPHDSSMFVRTATTAVSRHHVTPDFFEEVKVALPLTFSEKLHILFTFAHISCKKDLCTYSTVGYAWLPISPDVTDAARSGGRGSSSGVHCSGVQLSVFASLPHCYLSCQSLGLGKGLSMPDVKFVGKDLFRVSTVLISSVASRDADIHQTLASVIKITRSARDDSKEISQMLSLERNIPKMLRSLTDCDRNELVHFSHIILQQLFKLLVFAANQDLIGESFRTILALVERFKEANQMELLHGFIEETFRTAEFCGVYVHDQLIVILTKAVTEAMNPSSSSSGGGSSGNTLGLRALTATTQSSSSLPEEVRQLLDNLWFILRVMTKSMIQYLVDSGRATLDREDRFEPEFTANLKRFLETTSALIATYSRAEEAPRANQAISHFLTRLCSFFDRYVVFNAFYHHVSILSSRDIVVQELKLSAISILLAHEHFTAYCNPLVDSTIDSIDCLTGRRSFLLTADFARKHFPVFVALAEFKSAYAHRSPTLTNRALALYIVRNQLAKHLLEDRGGGGGGVVVGHRSGGGGSGEYWKALQEQYRAKVLALYLPILSVILENTNRMVDSTIAFKDGKCTFGGTSLAHHTGGGFGSGSGGRPGTAGSGGGGGGGGERKSTSPYSTINEVPGLTLLSTEHGSNGLQLTRSSSEISNQSTISSISSFNSLTSSAASTLTNCTASTITSHNRTNSMVSTAQLAAATAAAASVHGSNRDKFSADEVRDLFVCLLAVVQVLDISRMNQLTPKSLKDLFLCLECSLNAFEYKPAASTRAADASKARTLPAYLTNFSFQDLSNNNAAAPSAPEIYSHYLLTQSLCIQSSLITLRTIHLYLDNDTRPIDTSIIAQILSIYLTLMSLPQSQSVLIEVFASLRYFVHKFALLLFTSDCFLSPIIEKVIKYSNSSLTPIRKGATDLLYCLLSTNLKRTRFETIVCVSRLASSDSSGLLYLQSSLNRIEALAAVDSRSSGTHLVDRPRGGNQAPDLSMGTVDEEGEEEVSILHIVGRIREILKATKQIREESSDPYLASELRLQLANSYSRTSRSLLRTWLENLAVVHERAHDWTEAALCLCQVIAVLIEQLASKEIDISEGLAHIAKVSDNIAVRESIKQESGCDWLELEESHVSVEVLEKMVKEAVEKLEKGGLWELAPHVLKVMMGTYEREYEHKKLAELYQRMAKCHEKVQEINDSGKRLFDTFFRVAFYYPSQYGAQKTEYIYKCSKVVSLAEMTGTMQALYPQATFLTSDPESLSAFNAAQLAADASLSDLSIHNHHNSQFSGRHQHHHQQSMAIVITHVTPYVEGARNAFEKAVGVQQFVYEQRLGGKIAQSVAEQYKRRVILTTGNSFPYFLKRIPVADRREVILSPIEVAIDEMTERVHQLEHVIGSRDAKHLQLVLQGSVNATVNAGPIAYANAFLRKPALSNEQEEEEAMNDEVDGGGGGGECRRPSSVIENLEDSSSSFFLSPDTMEDHFSTSSSITAGFSESQKHLKFLFEQFLDLCEGALKLNEKLIKPNQVEYHQNLKVNFEKLKDELDFFYERPTSIQIFDVISGSTFA